jgi:hypothetical protein
MPPVLPVDTVLPDIGGAAVSDDKVSAKRFFKNRLFFKSNRQHIISFSDF